MPDSKAKQRWIRENTTKLTIKFMNKSDADILQYLEDKQKATVVKKALRDQMEQEGFVYVPPEQTDKGE